MQVPLEMHVALQHGKCYMTEYSSCTATATLSFSLALHVSHSQLLVFEKKIANDPVKAAKGQTRCHNFCDA